MGEWDNERSWRIHCAVANGLALLVLATVLGYAIWPMGRIHLVMWSYFAFMQLASGESNGLVFNLVELWPISIAIITLLAALVVGRRRPRSIARRGPKLALAVGMVASFSLVMLGAGGFRFILRIFSVG